MKTRMEKYYESNSDLPLREQKNEHLYQNISNYKIDDYKLDTNVAVLNNDARNIDVEQIKKILDTRYNMPKRRSIMIEEEPVEEENNIDLDETREYDINAILEQARNEKEADYETERVKKLRDTQFSILKSLNLDKKEEKEDAKEEIKENSELMDLINTITSNEMITKKDEGEMDPLDILSDLKGNDDTVVVGGIHENEPISETNPIMTIDEADKVRNDLSNTLQFTQSDFDDFIDLKKEVRSNKALIYTIISIVGLIALITTIILLKKLLIP